tara:strand:- start:483 stop:971 length:489 start_codon:yes stop_codon:yes gene_type:complete
MNELTCTSDEIIDALECSMLLAGDLIEFPLIHRFTPGVYSREIFMPKGSIATSKVHATEHQYVVLSGTSRVYIDGVGIKTLRAGDTGVTVPGTRRALYMEEDSRWIAFHPLDEAEMLAKEMGYSDEEMIALIEDRIIERREIPGMDGLTLNDIYVELLEGGQ